MSDEKQTVEYEDKGLLDMSTKIIASTMLALFLSTALPAADVVPGSDGQQAVEAAAEQVPAADKKWYSGVTGFFGKTKENAVELKDAYFKATEREKKLKLQIKALEEEILHLEEELAEKQAIEGMDHRRAIMNVQHALNYLQSISKEPLATEGE